MRIVMCGVGALGGAAAVACRNLDATLRLVDFDRVESKNVMAQAFVRQSIGKNKAMALKLQLHNFFGLRVEAFGVRLTDANATELLAEGDLLVDCFDNAESRTLVSRFARATDKACVHAALSADGTYGMVRWDEDSRRMPRITQARRPARVVSTCRSSASSRPRSREPYRSSWPTGRGAAA